MFFSIYALIIPASSRIILEFKGKSMRKRNACGAPLQKSCSLTIPYPSSYPVPHPQPETLPTGSTRFPYRFHPDWSVRSVSVWQRERWDCWKHRWEKPCAPKEVTLIECDFKMFQILSKDLVAEENTLRTTVFLTQYEKQFQYPLPKSVKRANICLSIEKGTTLPKAGAGGGNRSGLGQLRGSVGLPNIPGVSARTGGNISCRAPSARPRFYWIFLCSRILRKVKYVKH